MERNKKMKAKTKAELVSENEELREICNTLISLIPQKEGSLNDAVVKIIKSKLNK